MDPHVAQLTQRIERLERALRLMTALSRSTAPAIDTGSVQTIQGQIDPLSLRDNIPTLLNYGFSSSLPIGGDKAMIFLNGDRSQGVVVATGHQTYRYRGLQPGQSVMHDMWGHSLLMASTGAALVGNLSITGNLTVSGEITAGAGTAGSVTVQQHKHAGVATGTGSTAAPTAGS
jgi:phage gp45-like